ncbi:leucyl/phenylalanyl-tRNA--protein transferase [Parapedobacter indicus]|uniref:Leucyl/phenylalanyl-tRNA--protein transferase n=1 Tax=Parapedobacter indicus TaxID=1477437 RepID=A0A1I3T8G9_9SPHI|nr:leucyl/phenylalanyl-tRNA--protein transferase [Parapedobacter indicus]PPK99610.1 leucyl/phenylalanyl-tRNA--protein transferase [Parapedobacter indicus]SFJ66609.1 leucyl/phenylalanyl-tRNA--protein transferase [Parapedobacter indicus]
MIFELDEHDIRFPDPALAEHDGLLAIGGDLTSDRLLEAYRQGIFPWYNDDTPILWYSPHERFVLFPDELKISKSMRQLIRSERFRVTYDHAFSEVIAACSMQPRRGQDGTWITEDMQKAYNRLHELGHAHSVETWYDDTLAGGLYGIAQGQVFCGESMFSREANASKMALISLCQSNAYRLIDCQVYTDHLASLGARMIPRWEYVEYLS